LTSTGDAHLEWLVDAVAAVPSLGRLVRAVLLYAAETRRV